MELFIGYVKTFPSKIVGGGLEWYVYVCNGGLVACVRVRTMGGSNFCHFGAHVLTE